MQGPARFGFIGVYFVMFVFFSYFAMQVITRTAHRAPLTTVRGKGCSTPHHAPLTTFSPLLSPQWCGCCEREGPQRLSLRVTMGGTGCSTNALRLPLLLRRADGAAGGPRAVVPRRPHAHGALSFPPSSFSYHMEGCMNHMLTVRLPFLRLIRISYGGLAGGLHAGR